MYRYKENEWPLILVLEIRIFKWNGVRLDGSVDTVNGWLLNEPLSIPETGTEFSPHCHSDRTWSKPVNLLKHFFAAWEVKRSDREADYFHSGPRLRMRSDLFRGEIRRPFNHSGCDITSLWTLRHCDVIVDVTSQPRHCWRYATVFCPHAVRSVIATHIDCWTK
jgi:hypothetical protein